MRFYQSYVWFYQCFMRVSKVSWNSIRVLCEIIKVSHNLSMFYTSLLKFHEILSKLCAILSKFHDILSKFYEIPSKFHDILSKFYEIPSKFIWRDSITFSWYFKISFMRVSQDSMIFYDILSKIHEILSKQYVSYLSKCLIFTRSKTTIWLLITVRNE